jgi:hypothetical protein
LDHKDLKAMPALKDHKGRKEFRESKDYREFKESRVLLGQMELLPPLALVRLRQVLLERWHL